MRNKNKFDEAMKAERESQYKNIIDPDFKFKDRFQKPRLFGALFFNGLQRPGFRSYPLTFRNAELKECSECF